MSWRLSWSNSQRKPRSFEEEANFISRLFVLYLNPLFNKGQNKETPIEHEDLGLTSEQDKTRRLYHEFSKQWEYECRLPSEQRSLWYVLWRTVSYGKLFLAISLYAGYSICSFVPILILNALVSHFEDQINLQTWVLWVLVVLMFIVPMFGTVLAAQSNLVLAHAGVQFRNALIAAIYRKALRLSPAARQQSSTGQIVNMFSTDTQQLQRFLFFLNNLFLAPFVIGLALFLIYQQVGVATFVGLGLIILTIPLNGLIFDQLGKVRKQKVEVTDKRVKLMNEILNGIRIIKYYAWEVAFKERVEGVRMAELVLLRTLAYIIAVAFTLVLMAVPVFLPVLIFYTYVRLGNQLDAAKAFTTIALFNLMQFPFIFLPLGLTQYNQSRVSTQRIMKFLDSEELSGYVDTSGPLPPPPTSESATTSTSTADATAAVVIQMTDVSMSWVDAEMAAKTAADAALKVKQDASVAAAAAAAEGKDKAQQAAKEQQPTASVVSAAAKYAKVESDDPEDKEGPDEKQLQKKKEEGAAGEAEMVPVVGATNTTAKATAAASAESPEHEATALVASSSAASAAATAVDDPASNHPEYDAKLDRSLNTLVDLNFSIKQGELVAVVGSVGSGKSSLLNGLLGQMILLKGKVAVRGSIAFCDQRPWIINDTVQNNILFGLPYDEERFDAALHAANIEEDLTVLPGGIQTQIGERGINLSGGQKARVALARAIYRDADIYLLDDPLSAVDAHVGQFLFQEGLCNTLKDKTRILVTHQVHLLPQCDKIIVFDNGVIRAMGSYDELQQSGIDISDLVPSAEVSSDPATTTTTGSNPAGLKKSASSQAKLGSGEDSSDPYKVMREKSRMLAAVRKQDSRATTINTKEERSTGDVNFDIYWYYIKSGGKALFALLLACVVMSQVCMLFASFWLAEWGDVARDREEEDRPLSADRNIWYLNIYGALSCGVLFFYLFRSLTLANHRLYASEELHKGLLKATLFAPVAFYDVTPIGRVLNRFSSDLQTVDEEIAQTMSQGLNSAGAVLGAIGAIAGATKGTFLALIIPIAWFYHMVQKFFNATNTSIARLEAISRSPIYADFSQALGGMTTIRAYADSERFIAGLEKCVDSNSIANVSQQMASQWLAIRLDLIGAFVSFFIALIAVAVPGFIPPGFLGLGLAYSFQLTSYLKFLVRMVASLEAQMNAVERVKYYMNNIETEGDTRDSLPLENIPPNWPEKGVIKGQDLEMRYRDGPLVLKGLSFYVRGGAKVGLAGRTGSGKSSLMVGLFRIQELASGTLTIDDIDISQVPLSLLRSKLGIIPQDPVMFSASVRFNLDPFNVHSDADIWDVLSSINMKEHVLSLPGKLAEEVAEGGDNFSAGQRQLICIARAILRKPKILVLDEATASIDNETDAVVQQMVRSQFKDCTVLTIAHRLNTIIDSDKIMVMDDGKLAEFDAPTNLLEDPSETTPPAAAGVDADASRPSDATAAIAAASAAAAASTGTGTSAPTQPEVKDGFVVPSKGLFKSLWEKHLESHGQE